MPLFPFLVELPSSHSFLRLRVSDEESLEKALQRVNLGSNSPARRPLRKVVAPIVPPVKDGLVVFSTRGTGKLLEEHITGSRTLLEYWYQTSDSGYRDYWNWRSSDGHSGSIPATRQPKAAVVRAWRMTSGKGYMPKVREV